MLTKIIIEGVMGREFGRVWHLDVDSPNEALRMIDANKPGLFNWIRKNLAIYDRYKVICTYEDGSKEHLDNDTYSFSRKVKVIRFVPVPAGSGSTAKIVIGVIMIAVGVYTGQGWLVRAGAMMVVSGVIEALTPMPSIRSNQGGSTNVSSNYFDGPVNTSQQGSPVFLIYGKDVMVGSQLVSASMTIENYDVATGKVLTNQEVVDSLWKALK